MKQQRKLQLFSVEKRKRKIHEIVYERKLLLYSCNRYLLTNSYDTVNNQSSKQASKAKQSKAKQKKEVQYSRTKTTRLLFCLSSNKPCKYRGSKIGIVDRMGRMIRFIHSILFDSIRFYSILFYSIRFDSIRFDSIRFDSILPIRFFFIRFILPIRFPFFLCVTM
jgi:hypothetical protein